MALVTIRVSDMAGNSNTAQSSRMDRAIGDGYSAANVRQRFTQALAAIKLLRSMLRSFILPFASHPVERFDFGQLTMKILALAGISILFLSPSGANAQSNFDGRWKIDVGTFPLPKGTFVWLLQNRMYERKSCTPPIEVPSDGKDHAVTGHAYDTISVSIVDNFVVKEIEKKDGKIVSYETYTLSADGNVVTDAFAGWRLFLTRVVAGPTLRTAHPLSGTWQPWRLESDSDTPLLLVFKIEGDYLSMSRPTGESFRAKLDGTDSPYVGDPSITAVSIKLIDGNSIEETDKVNDKPVSIVRRTIAADGKSMAIEGRDLQTGIVTRLSAKKLR
jgi:hypothetical protein